MSIIVDIALPGGAEIDVALLQVYPEGKVRGDGDMCFYGQPEISGGAVRLTSGTKPRFDVDLARLAADVERLVLTAAVDGGMSFGQLGDVRVTVGGHDLPVSGQGRSERALILAEIYKRNGAWKVRNVGQGFDGGLAALATHFGVVIAAEAAPTPPPPAEPPKPAPRPSAAPAAPSVNLSKVSLTKQEKTVSLKKSDGRFGTIRINLNWNQKKKASGLFGLGKTGIDLDVGAFVETADGSRTAIQALGEAFGDFDRAPYVKLRGDDRTGATSDGEWLDINGDRWSDVRRVLVYAFIYEGAANWQETDGVVRVLVPGQPEVEVRMNDFGSQHGMCAVVELSNDSGQIRLERKVEFFPGHRYMDEAYGWGFRWQSGRK